MNILLIDTSTKACVVAIALVSAAGKRIFSKVEMIDRTHSKVILPHIDQLLLEAEVQSSELDFIVYGRGPGSFTGLRIGVGVVQGLAFGLDIPVVGVSSMACLAQSVFRTQSREHSLVALLARNREVYFGSYSVVAGVAAGNGVEGVFESTQTPIQDHQKSWVGIGSGWQFQAELESSMQVTVSEIHEQLYPAPEDLLELGLSRKTQGLATTALEAKPEYLREQVANLPSAG